MPGPTDYVFFDGNGTGSCLLDATVAIDSLNVGAGYTGTISQSTYPITVTSDSSFMGGAFNGGSAPVTLGNVYLKNDFTSTSGLMTVGGSFYFKEEPPLVSNPQVVLDEFTLDAQNISDKYVVLSDLPQDSSTVALNVIGGGPQNFGSDYTVSGFFLSWSGLALGGLLESGDTLRALYSDQGSAAASVFGNNDGTVLMKAADNWAFMGGIRFKNLQVQEDTSGSLRVDSSSYVENSLSLESGYIARNLDATIHVLMDATCYADYGMSGTGCPIMFDGTGRQTLLYSGGILPTLVVNKQVSDHVRCYGTGPITVEGDVLVQDGTFNMNGLSLSVGAS